MMKIFILRALVEKKKLNFTKSIELLRNLEEKHPDNLIIQTSLAEKFILNQAI